MRLWTLHPKYLDRQGLLAVWREGLLAKSVLENWATNSEKSIAYRNHPQLDRFKKTNDSVAAISLYLAEIFIESKNRNYCFDGTKIEVPKRTILIPVKRGQIEYEREHLLKKLLNRDPQAAKRLQAEQNLQLHSLFVASPGEIEPWEKRK